MTQTWVDESLNLSSNSGEFSAVDAFGTVVGRNNIS